MNVALCGCSSTTTSTRCTSSSFHFPSTPLSFPRNPSSLPIRRSVVLGDAGETSPGNSISEESCSRSPIPLRHADDSSGEDPSLQDIRVTTEEVNYVQLYRRRKLLVVATCVPFLFAVQENGRDCNAVAEESVSSLYLLMKEEIRKVVSKGKAAGVLRLVFHDAGTFEARENLGGMNGSIIYELDRPENQGLKKSLKILQKAKSVVDETHTVSWADMISVAGAEAVSICGGPSITFQLGRIDSMVPDPEGKLPEESLDASGLKETFQRKGFSTQELVALSGAHTLGSKGFGSPITFDNSYYKILLERPWLSSASMSSMVGLPSDRALVDDDECLRWITKYADDQEAFFWDFSSAFIKLVNSGAKWRNLQLDVD